MDDRSILLLMREHPAQGLNAAIDQYSSMVNTIVRRILYGYEEDVEECVADAFVTLWETAPTLDPEDSSLKAYLICIARNLAINRYNYLKRRRAVSLEGAGDILPDPKDLESEVLRSENIQVLLEAVEGLSELNREIMVRRYFLFEPVKQIAARLGLKNTSVANRIQYAKLHLRKSLVTKGVSL